MVSSDCNQRHCLLFALLQLCQGWINQIHQDRNLQDCVFKPAENERNLELGHGECLWGV